MTQDPSSKVRDKIRSGEIPAEVGAKLLGLRNEAATHARRRRATVFSYGLTAGFLLATGLAIVVMVPQIKLAHRVAPLPACRDLADSSSLWDGKRTMCAMDDEKWLCERGRCERVPAVP